MHQQAHVWKTAGLSSVFCSMVLGKTVLFNQIMMFTISELKKECYTMVERFNNIMIHKYIKICIPLINSLGYNLPDPVSDTTTIHSLHHQIVSRPTTYHHFESLTHLHSGLHNHKLHTLCHCSSHLNSLASLNKLNKILKFTNTYL